MLVVIVVGVLTVEAEELNFVVTGFRSFSSTMIVQGLRETFVLDLRRDRNLSINFMLNFVSCEVRRYKGCKVCIETD